MSTINPIRVRFKKDHITFSDLNIALNGLLIFLDAADINSLFWRWG